MSIASEVRSRRALLTAGLGAFAATVAGAITRPDSARAHDPDDVRLGGNNFPTATTGIQNTTTDSIVVWAVSSSGVALRGSSYSESGVLASSNSGNGVVATSESAAGVWASSVGGNGVHGLTNTAVGSGVYGENTHQGYGVAGRSNSAPLGANGVFAAATLGDNTANGVGVWARSTHGVGLYADAAEADAVALQANGVTQFRRSGKLTVKAGKGAATKTGIRIDPRSLVLAVLQEDRPGVHVRSAVPNPAGDSFTVRLNTVVATDTKVGWFVVN